MASSSPEFHNFSLLPTELRLQIWSLAIPKRVLTISCVKDVETPTKRRYVKSFSTAQPPPSLLTVNRESRSIALLHYNTYFRSTFHPRGIWASFAHDTVSFYEGTISYLGPAELEGIESMTLEVKDHAYFGYFNLSTLRSMRNLRELKLVVEKGVSYSWESGDPTPDILRDLETEVEEWPEWEIPEIRIVQKETGLDIVCIRRREDLLLEEDEAEMESSGGGGSTGWGVTGGGTYGYHVSHHWL
jgi:hypothetical protein